MATSILPAEEDAPVLVPQPGSVTWRMAGDGRLMLASGYTLLLQVAHPVVGAGVTEHSNFRADPWGRLKRTLDYVNLTVFGGPRAAAETGRRVREMHKTIKGTRPDGRRYHALEPDAFAWVHATLAHSIVLASERFGVAPSPWEREVFYADWRRLGRLVGVRDRDLPRTWKAFEAYVERTMREQLEPTQAVRDVLDALARPAAPPLPLPTPAWSLLRMPAAHALRLTTAGLMAAGLRERLGLSWSRVDAAQFAAFAASQRASTPLLPRQIRSFGPTYLRLRGAG